MPRYLYTRPDGTQVEVAESITEMQARNGHYTCPDGVVARRDIAAEQRGARPYSCDLRYVSNAAGVHPKQIPDALEHARKNGCKVSFAPDGEAVFTSRLERKKYCRLVGLVDRRGGYGDP